MPSCDLLLKMLKLMRNLSRSLKDNEDYYSHVSLIIKFNAPYIKIPSFLAHGEDVVVDWFKDYYSDEFARGGFVATEKIVLPEGPLPDFSHAIEPHLRKLGMPTKLDKGIVTLINDFVVCEKGQTLTPEQAKILKLIGRPLAKFHVKVECSYSKDDGFKNISKDDDDGSSKKKGKKSIVKAKDRVKNSKKGAKKSSKNDSKMQVDSNGEEEEDEDEDEGSIEEMSD